MESALKKGSGRQGRKQFFFEKKNQKTFPGCFARVASSAAGMTAFGCLRDDGACEAPGKSFLVLFFKKEPLSFPCLTASLTRERASFSR
jgi:hypothetical protein